MKTYYSVIILSALLVSALCFVPIRAVAATCDTTTAIVYSNGMFNDRKLAEKSRQKLEDALIASNPAYSNTQLYELNHLAYASGGWEYRINGEYPIQWLMDALIVLANALGQTAEVIFQRVLQDDFSSFWRWLGGIEAAPR